MVGGMYSSFLRYEYLMNLHPLAREYCLSGGANPPLVWPSRALEPQKKFVSDLLPFLTGF